MHQKKNEFIIGLIIVIAIIAVIIGKMVFTEKKLKKDFNRITVIFPKVGGLEVGSSVFVNGVRAGEVENIDLFQNSVKVNLLIRDDVTLYSDSRIMIIEEGIMGERKIEITAGKNNEIKDITQPLKGIYIPDLHESIAEFRYTLKTFEKFFQTLEIIINQEKEKRTLSSLIENINKLVITLNNELNQESKLTEKLSQINRIIENADYILEENREKIERIVSFSESTIPDIKILLSRMKNFTKQLEKKDTNLSRLTANDSLYRKIDHTISIFDSLVTDIKKNPKKYFSLF